MLRLRFKKLGRSVWISHLDTMRLFQRAFKRAGLKLTHTQGFNPRPSVSIALPLSVGIESYCELLDFDLEEPADCSEIKSRLNAALVEGIMVTDVYDCGEKLKHLGLMDCSVIMHYDAGTPQNAVDCIASLLKRPTLLVEKKGKKGVTQQDIIPLIKGIACEQTDEKTLVLRATICCQEPSLNPMQILAAIDTYIPELSPDSSRCVRHEVYYRQSDPNQVLKKFM